MPLAGNPTSQLSLDVLFFIPGLEMVLSTVSLVAARRNGGCTEQTRKDCVFNVKIWKVLDCKDEQTCVEMFDNIVCN
jgi:hypothetical protein